MKDNLNRTFRFYKHEARKLLTKLYFKLIPRKPGVSIKSLTDSLGVSDLEEKSEAEYLKAFRN